MIPKEKDSTSDQILGIIPDGFGFSQNHYQGAVLFEGYTPNRSSAYMGPFSFTDIIWWIDAVEGALAYGGIPNDS